MEPLGAKRMGAHFLEKLKRFRERNCLWLITCGRFKGVFGKDSYLKLGADVLNSRDDKGTNISQSLNLLVNTDGSLSPFVLPGADERTAWSVDAWLKLGPFDLIGEYLEEYVNGRTVNGVPPGFADFTTSGYYITAAYFLIPKKLQAAVQWQDLNPG